MKTVRLDDPKLNELLKRKTHVEAIKEISKEYGPPMDEDTLSFLGAMRGHVNDAIVKRIEELAREVPE